MVINVYVFRLANYSKQIQKNSTFILSHAINQMQFYFLLSTIKSNFIHRKDEVNLTLMRFSIQLQINASRPL